MMRSSVHTQRYQQVHYYKRSPVLLDVLLLALQVVALLLTVGCANPKADYLAAGTGGVNARQHLDKPYLLLVSIDGFRWDYMDLYPTPNMDRIAAAGVRAEYLAPVFPTLTFPNHYSIATGLYPEGHGLVSNDFPDPASGYWYSLKNRETVEDSRFYAGQPIWVTAEIQGMVAAAFFFVGTEAAIGGVQPSHWRSYDKGISGQARVDQVLSWLAEPEQSRPHLYTLYFEDVDDHAHWYGPASGENVAAIERVDAYLGRLLEGLDKLPYGDRVNIMLVSDHGQAAYLEDPKPYVVGNHVNLDGVTVIEGGSYLFMHLDRDDPQRASAIVDTVNATWQHGQAWLPGASPEHWHIRTNPRWPDVILVPEVGYAVLSSIDKAHKINPGDHGWAPDTEEMRGIFIASGPGILPGASLGPINAVDIYSLMAAILGLRVPDALDGDACALAGVLRLGEDIDPPSHMEHCKAYSN